MRKLVLPRLILILVVLVPFAINAQSNPPTEILFKNVRVFNGVDDKLSESTHVLVRGNKIVVISEYAAD